ncbi:Hypothetical protein FKW44_010995 [Caligus rogercresseyi]|uniref:Uncharacterized protein n=1 Tax=Caligus rogercresseyi TaxID=217165 RepID=A0A7T8HHE0_CALRO|nr:Hypothetical protein FKW44_010995 [Caligus rogercresseyi]
MSVWPMMGRVEMGYSWKRDHHERSGWRRWKTTNYLSTNSDDCFWSWAHKMSSERFTMPWGDAPSAVLLENEV